jgi:Skp family chaperone for outer membrane proteins
MTGRAALAVLFVLCLAGAAAAQTQADPVAYVQAIYARYQHNNPPAWYDQNYSARLKKLIDADQKEAQANGDAGKFDWDPIINAQDWKLSALKVTLVSKSGDTAAIVDAAFNNLGSKQRMRFTLVRQADKWAIDDIAAVNKPRWSMSKILEAAPDAFPDETAK